MKKTVRNLMKLIIAVCGAFSVLCAGMPAQAAEKKNFSMDGIVYEQIDESGNVRISGLEEKGSGAGDLIITAQITHKETVYNVKEIGNAAFAFSDIENAVIPEGIDSIGASAFAGCARLKSITLPKSVTKIGDGAFSYCPELENIVIDENNNDFVFEDGILYSKDMKQVYRVLEAAGDTVKISKNTVKIRPYAFEGNSAIGSVVLPEKLKKICKGAFMDCALLTGIEIPAGVTKIEGNPFMYCPKLSSITVAASNKNYFSTDTGLLLNIKKTVLISASSARNKLVIPDGVKRIAEGAATGNTSLKTVEICSSVKKIDAYAFADCTGLKEVRFTTRKITLNSSTDSLPGVDDNKGRIFKNTDYFINFKIPYSPDANSEGSIEEAIRSNSPKGVIITFR